MNLRRWISRGRDVTPRICANFSLMGFDQILLLISTILDGSLNQCNDVYTVRTMDTSIICCERIRSDIRLKVQKLIYYNYICIHIYIYSACIHTYISHRLSIFQKFIDNLIVIYSVYQCDCYLRNGNR